MTGDRPSITAILVALGRAAATLAPTTSPRFEDPLAPALLPRGLGWLVADGAPAPTLRQGVLRAVSLGLVDHMALRSLAIDDALSAADPDEVVLLGAGLDARALRLPRRPGRRFFEVDHPSSQRHKRARLAEAGVDVADVHFAPIDFTREALEPVLTAAGFDRARRSFFVWEGVTMYLPREATEATLRALGALASPGSAVALTYMETPARPIPASLRAALDAGLAIVGEPLGATYARPELRELVEAHGFELASDTANDTWAARYGARALPAAAFRAERLAVAFRVG